MRHIKRIAGFVMLPFAIGAVLVLAVFAPEMFPDPNDGADMERD